jgi:cation diffusion facilitator family transporter
MRRDAHAHWQHSHDFNPDSGRAETSTRRVMLLTAVMMVVEIVAGITYGSMALLADGWHMATHVAAFGISVFAYRYARANASNPRYSFGTGKVGTLGGFASAVALAVVALVMALESLQRVMSPHAIRFDEAILVAVVGLMVNLVSGMLLHGAQGHDHHHGHAHDHHDHDHDYDHDHDHDHHSHGAQAHHDHGHHDHNLRAAYLHVIADALTSVLAIAALLAGRWLGWNWLDPMMGLVGAALIARWAWGLIRDSGHVLLDGAADEPTREAIRRAIETQTDSLVTDLHVWAVGPRSWSASLAVLSHDPLAPQDYKRLLHGIPRLEHVLIEVNLCPGEICKAPG